MNNVAFFFPLESFIDVDADFHAKVPVVVCKEKQRSHLANLCVPIMYHNVNNVYLATPKLQFLLHKFKELYLQSNNKSESHIIKTLWIKLKAYLV